jgi:putative SOS response-associated peptidase YedK
MTSGKPVILVVEDEALVRMLAVSVAEDSGFEALSAASADEVTTRAAPSVQPYHHRMPLILEATTFQQWMLGMPNEAAALMVPYGGAIEAWEVGADVSNVRNNCPELMERVGLL